VSFLNLHHVAATLSVFPAQVGADMNGDDY